MQVVFSYSFTYSEFVVGCSGWVDPEVGLSEFDVVCIPSIFSVFFLSLALL